ncbi:MAG: hypothetical protein Kow0098_09920 [Ignavibacteriaceae bacterium]
MKIISFVFLLLALSQQFILAQYNQDNFSVGIGAVYTTSAQIFLNPNSSDPVLRNRSNQLEDILNVSIDLRYRLTEAILLGFNIERMKKTGSQTNITVFSQGSTLSIPANDGFLLIPAEITLYYYLPFSSDNFIFLMGGGGGYYYGEFLRSAGDAKVAVREREFAYGIHVAISMDYIIRDFISVRGGMKFRDPQFTVTNSYNSQEFVYEGNTVTIPQKEFDTKINVDGVTFTLSLVFHF